MHDQQHAVATKYAFVTNGVARAIRKHQSGRELSDAARDALRRGAEWLLEMRRGTELVTESNSGALGYSAESIPAAVHALRVVNVLSLATKSAEVQELLTRMEVNLHCLAAGTLAAPPDELDLLLRFFEALGSQLTQEAVEGSLGSALDGVGEPHEEKLH